MAAFPVQCRFSADGSDDWHLCVCSPGEVSPYWLLVLLSSGGEWCVPFTRATRSSPTGSAN
nr:conjugation system SOS inhibitor PsiB family protein [Enterobacter hormaechei]